MGQTQTKKNSGDVARTDEKASSQPSAAALTADLEKQALTEEEKQFLQLCYERKADISRFKSLLEKGVRLNIHDKDGWHPIWLVSERGRTDLVDLFLQRGADVDLPTANKFGETALIPASHYGHCETVKLLLQRGASINCQHKDGVTALYFACKNIHVAVVQLLLKSGAQVNKGSDPPLYTASLEGRLNIVQILLDHGADVNQPNDTEKRSSPLIAACGHNHPQVSQLLINHNADVNYQDSNGDTPIHFAAGSGHLEVVKLLVQSHANLNVKDNNYGNTPLHWGSKKGNPKVVKILVQSQANLNVKNKLGGNTPLHLAVGNGHSEVVKELLLSQAKLDIKNNAGKTPLQVAEEKKYSEIVSLLKTGVPAPGEGEREGESERSSETEGDQVPSGHILTKLEHQVLANLLAAYSDEKLKEIQLSIQEKQDVGQISREEVERSLRQSGLVSVADGLKESIDKGVENAKHYEAYERALQDGISLTLRYLKFLFLGPPRSGKTSARRRLLREIINLSSLGQPSKSTGAAETSDVVIKKLVCESTAIIDSTWQSIHKSQGDSSNTAKQQEGELTELARWFYRLISAATATASDGAKTTIVNDDEHQPRPAMLSSESGELETDLSSDFRPDFLSDSRSNDSEDLEIKAALEELSIILQLDSPLKLEQILRELIMISMVDIGGQPAFLEMLPSLTIGPALYFLFFRLDQELGKSYKVRYHASDNETETILESYYCTENVLYQSLSSIACFGCHSQKDDVSSGVLLFGTYKDKVSADRISQVAGTLEEKLLKTKLYQEGLLLKTSKGNLFFSLNNMNGDESEMSEIRSDVEEIVKKHFSATPIPAAWLMFRIVLHLLRKPVLSLAQCRTIARKLSMRTSVEEALWFFHHNIGNLMYYSDIPSMQDTVICDPQVIFDSVSELIIDRFRHCNRSLSSYEVDDFHRKGQFSLAQIDDKTESQRSGHLKLVQMVDLLKDLNIIAEIKEDEDEIKASSTDQSHPTAANQSRPPSTDQSQPKFIMPAVLKYASEEELKIPDITNPDDRSVPIMVHFESGFVPFGIFCATTAHIIARQDSLSPKWRMCDDQVMRNKITFNIDRAFFATIISRDQYLEIHVSRHPHARKRKSLSFICSTIRQTVVNSLQAVISKMKFKHYVKMDTSFFSSRQPFALAFTCCLEDSHSNHLMRVVEDSPTERCAECITKGVETDLKDEHMVWFDEELEKQSKSENHSVETPVTTPSRDNVVSTVLDRPAQVISATPQVTDVKCPVCLNIQIDPCTLSCGHSICQLCLARLWKDNEKFCPVCKQTWREFPAISYDYRTSIEGSYHQQVDQIRKQYTEEDKQCIESFLEARNFSLKSEKTAKKTLSTYSEVFKGEDICDLNNEQLAVWLSNHPRLRGTDYQHGIQKLKEAKMDGFAFLSLDKGSLEQLGLSIEFQTPLMKITKDLKQYQHTLKSKIQPKSLTSEAATSDEHAVTEFSSTQPTETIKTETEETDASQFISAQPPELDVWRLPGVDECGETSVVISSSQGQLVDWNGLKLHIHEGSLPEGLHQCTIYIKASLAGDYEIPENSSLVSAVFWLRCEPQCTFTKPVTVEIQHCSTKQDLSRLKIVRAFCNQKQLPYKFKPLGGRFDADTSYGAIEVNSFSGVGVIEENRVSGRMYYSQLFYRSCYSHHHKHEIHIIFTWNTEAHINQASHEYPKENFLAGCHKVIELVGDVIEVALDAAKWTKVMDGQWEIQPAQPMVTKAALDDFEPGRGLPNCVIEARPLCEDFPQLLHQIIFSGIKPPHHKVILSYMPSRTYRDHSSDANTHVQQRQTTPRVQSQVDVPSRSSTFSKDMSNEQLAVWLRNHPSLTGTNYEEDIRKLRDARVSGNGFLSLDEGRLERLGVSLGFLLPLVNIIQELKRSHDSEEKLPSQQQQKQSQAPSGSAATSTTERQLTSSQATGKQTKFDKLPTLDELLILKYMDKGEKKKLRIISEASHKWTDIANLICGDANVTSVLEQKYHSDPNKCLKQTFISYFISKKPQRYTQDWNGLIELLDDVDLETLAKNVKQALPYVCT